MKPKPFPADIDHIRRSSRAIVRELGFLKRGLAGTDLSPSAVHALVEIGSGTVATATELVTLLGLDKSTVSRLLGRLEADGLLTARKDAADPRRKELVLTPAGERLFRQIDTHARDQVDAALSPLSAADRAVIVDGLVAYARALHDGASAVPALPARKDVGVLVQTGYVPTLLARVTEMHARYYAVNYGFGAVFERQVAADMAEFLSRLDNPVNLTARAERGGRIIGAVSIDGEDLGCGVAHLRWFILDDTARGQGVGGQLIERALAHVDGHGFRETRLWTFKGLDAARHLYEKAGFVLVDERPGTQWGTEVIEQVLSRKGSRT